MACTSKYVFAFIMVIVIRTKSYTVIIEVYIL